MIINLLSQLEEKNMMSILRDLYNGGEGHEDQVPENQEPEEPEEHEQEPEEHEQEPEEHEQEPEELQEQEPEELQEQEPEEHEQEQEPEEPKVQESEEQEEQDQESENQDLAETKKTLTPNFKIGGRVTIPHENTFRGIFTGASIISADHETADGDSSEFVPCNSGETDESHLSNNDKPKDDADDTNDQAYESDPDR